MVFRLSLVQVKRAVERTYTCLGLRCCGPSEALEDLGAMRCEKRGPQPLRHKAKTWVAFCSPTCGTNLERSPVASFISLTRLHHRMHQAELTSGWWWPSFSLRCWLSSSLVCWPGGLALPGAKTTDASGCVADASVFPLQCVAPKHSEQEPWRWSRTWNCCFNGFTPGRNRNH